MTSIDSSFIQLIAALDYAAQEHRGQRRKDIEATPYINHPIALLRILAVEAGITDLEVLTTAVLHDVIEDCSGKDQEFIGMRREEIGAGFGMAVLELVEAVTDDKKQQPSERKLAQIEHAADLPRKARLVKLADKIANVRDIAHSPPHDWDAQRITTYFDWAERVVDRMRGTDARLETLFDAAIAHARAAAHTH